MDISKFHEFFQPEKCRDRIHIVGCGAVGSTIGELLVRMGLTKFTLWDFDLVEPHNLANQMFRAGDIKMPKTEALAKIMMEINPNVDIKIKGKYEGQLLNGYVFMAVDKVAVRKKICQCNKGNMQIKAIFDARIRLEDAQGFAARWDNYQEVQNLLKSMDFTDEEADAATPVSACNMTLSVAPTVRIVCNMLVANFMNLFIDKNNWKTVFIINTFNFNIITSYF